MQLFLASLLALILQATASESSCEEISQLKGTISHHFTVYGRGHYRNCWKILNPTRQPITLKGDFLHFLRVGCNSANIVVTVNNKDYKFCDSTDYENDVVYGNTDVLVKYTVVRDNFYDDRTLKFQLSYEIGILSLPQIKETRLRLIDWLKSKRNNLYGWNENTARAIVALYLSDGATFNSTSLDEELMAKQLEVRTAIALLGQPVSNERLSMFINALLVTCRNPRHFYGQNLVKLLKDQVISATNFAHPMTYLALCNAKESWPSKAFEDLSAILRNVHKYPFMKDLQGLAVMALSCYRDNNNSFDDFENGTLKLDYERTVKEMKEQQLSDGSFGNVHTTALISQALFSNSTENATTWYPNAVEYLIKELNSSSLDFSSVTLSLPVLNGKSFADIAKVNCPTNDDDFPDIEDYSGPKMRIQYSLYIGDEKDVVHTISLRVPENFTAYNVMKVAEKEDPKYKFEMKRIHKDMYIYRIGSLMNDSVNGKFWLQYLKSSNATQLSYESTTADQLVLEDGDHLVMWYRRPIF